MAATIELKSASDVVTKIEDGDAKRERDDRVLLRLGKNPVLKRNFGFLTMLAFSSCVMLTWEGILIVLGIGLSEAGYAGSVYGYIIVWLGSASAFTTMAELSSMAATAAGQYHWVAILAPKRCRVFLSYIIGWLTCAGWQGSIASNAYVSAQMALGVAILNNPDLSFQPWHTMLVYWAVVVFSIFINTVVARLLPKCEAALMFLHIFGFIAILVPMIYFAPHTDASTVFTSLTNDGMWPTTGLSFMIGLNGPIYSLLGVDSVIHMSEEIENPNMNVPRAIAFSTMINGALGFAMLIGTLFCLGDLNYILATPTGYPFMAVFQQAVGNLGGASTMVAILVIMGWVGSMSGFASTSRMTWSFARDNGLPGSHLFKSVEPRTTLPLWSIGLTAVIMTLLSLIVLGSNVAFNDVVSLAVSGLYSSYLVGNSLLLWRRITGQIQPYDPNTTTLVNTIGADQLTWGPWKIPEPLGTINNIFGCLYLFVMLFFTFWPTSNNPGPAGMNYSVLMTGGVVIFACVYYIVYGRKIYTGPVIEVRPIQHPISYKH